MVKQIGLNITRLKQPVAVHVIAEGGIQYNSNSSLVRWINEGNAVSTSFEDAEVVVFRGGQDINPAKYGQKGNSHLWNISAIRDEQEFDMFDKCVANKKIIVGICRGCQLATIKNGGILIQHVGHHYQNHDVIGTIDGEKYKTNSIHHQMCFPYYLPKEKYNILAYCTKDMFYPESQRKIEYYGENDLPFIPKGSHQPLSKSNFAEPEMIWYPETLSLGIQGHPENLTTDSKYIKYINKFLLNEITKQRT